MNNNEKRLARLAKIKSANKSEWKNMPEFNFRAQKPLRIIKIRIANQEDLDEFEKLIGQKIYPNINTYYFPKHEESLYSNLVYIDEENES